MEVRKGYKQTEVGVIPEDWDVMTMGELFNFQNGVNADKAAYGKGIPFINVLEVITHSTLDESRIPGRILLPNHICNSFKVQTGDVLFNRTSETQEEVGLASVYSDKKEVVFGGFVIRAQPKGKTLNPAFCSYALRFRPIRQQIVARGQGAVRANIGQQELSKVQVFIPSLLEQEAIAEALSDADALIESLTQLIAKKRQIKQGAMQELLTGKRRLHGFATANSGYKQTEVGVIPEDWGVKELGAIGEPLIGLTYHPNDVREFGTLVLRSSNIQENKLAFDDNVYVQMDIPDRAITQAKDLLICVRNGSRQLIGKCTLVDEKTAGSAFGAFMSVFRSEYSEFIFSQFQSDLIKRQINEVMGATINQITSKDLARFKVILPPTKAEQEAIAEVLSGMDAELAALEAKLAKARTLKQGMMHELLTGQIRLVKLA